jgi:hypothetical protein
VKRSRPPSALSTADATYATYSDGTTAISADRAPAVYFEGGKAKVTITPRVPDDSNPGSLIDGNPVEVVADMSTPLSAFVSPGVATTILDLSKTMVHDGVLDETSEANIVFTMKYRDSGAASDTTVQWSSQTPSGIGLGLSGLTFEQAIAKIESHAAVSDVLWIPHPNDSSKNALVVVPEPVAGRNYLSVNWVAKYWDGTTTQSFWNKNLDPITTLNQTGNNLIEAINAETEAGGSLEGVISGAAMVNGKITLTAAEVGKETFSVSDVTFDYAGLNQLASATYSTTNADYFAGGKLSLTVDSVQRELAQVSVKKALEGANGFVVNEVQTVAEFLAAGGNAADLVVGLYSVNSYEYTVKTYQDYVTDSTSVFGAKGISLAGGPLVDGAANGVLAPLMLVVPYSANGVDSYFVIGENAEIYLTENMAGFIDYSVFGDGTDTSIDSLLAFATQVDAASYVVSNNLALGALEGNERLELSFTTQQTAPASETRYDITVSYDAAGDSTVSTVATTYTDGVLSGQTGSDEPLTHAATVTDFAAALAIRLNALAGVTVTVDPAAHTTLQFTTEDGSKLLTGAQALSAYVSTTTEPLTVSADMVANDAAASLQALHDAVRGKLEGVAKVVIQAPEVEIPPYQDPDNPDQIISGEMELVPYDAGKTNAGGTLANGLYVDFWYVGIGETWFAGDGTTDPVSGEWVADDSEYNAGPTYFADMGAFLTYLETLPIVQSADIDGSGNIVITASQHGTLEVAIEIYNNAAAPGDEGPYINESGLTAEPSAALADANWKALVSGVELGSGEAAGTLTLASKDKVSEQFVIKEATLDTQGVAEQVSASFSDDSTRYYEGGKISVTVNNTLIEADMVPSQEGGTVLKIAEEDGVAFALTDSVDALGIPHPFIAGTYSKVVFNLHFFEDGMPYPSYYYKLELGMNTGGTVRAIIASDNKTVGDVLDMFNAASFTLNGTATPTLPATLAVADLIESASLNAAGEIAIVFKTDLMSIDDKTVTPRFENPALTLSVNNGAKVATLDGMTGPDDQYITKAPDISGAELSVNALKAAVEAKLADVDPSNPTDPLAPLAKIGKVEVVHNDESGQYDLVFTAKEAEFGNGEINISETRMSVQEVTQVTRINLEGVEFDTRVGVDGPAKLSVDIAGNMFKAGETITSRVGANDAETTRNLAQAIIDARDGVIAEQSATGTAVTVESAPALAFDFADDVTLDSKLSSDIISGSITLNEGTEDEAVIAINFIPNLKELPDTVTSTLQDFVDYLFNETDGVLNGKVESVAIVGGNLVITPKTGETISASDDLDLVVLKPGTVETAATLQADATPAQIIGELSTELVEAFNARYPEGNPLATISTFMHLEFTDANNVVSRIEGYFYFEQGTNFNASFQITTDNVKASWVNVSNNTAAPVTTLAEAIAEFDHFLATTTAMQLNGQPYGRMSFVDNTITFTAAQGYTVAPWDPDWSAGGLYFDSGYTDYASTPKHLSLAIINLATEATNALPFEIGSGWYGDLWVPETVVGASVTSTTVAPEPLYVIDFDLPASMYTPITGLNDGASITVDDTVIPIEFAATSSSTLGDLVRYLADLLAEDVESVAIEKGDLVITPNAGVVITDLNLSIDVIHPEWADVAVSAALANDTGVTEVDPGGNGQDTPAKVIATMTPWNGVMGISDQYVGYDIELLVNGEPDPITLAIAETVGLFNNTDTSVGLYNDSPIIKTTAQLAAKLNAAPTFAGKVVFSEDNGKLVVSTLETGSEASLQVVKLAISSTDFLSTASGFSTDVVNGADYIAPEAATVTLSAFAGLTGTEILTPGSYAYSLQVNGETISGTVDADGSTTVADYIAAVQAEVTLAEATLTLGDEGLVITTVDQSSTASISVSAGGLTFNHGQALPVEAVANVLGSVIINDGGDYDGQLVLTAKEAGADPLQVENVTGQVEDDELSQPQVIDIQFSNTALDNPVTTPAGTVVSVTINDVTRSVTLSTTQSGLVDGVTYVNVAGLTTTRSEAVVAALQAKVAADYSELLMAEQLVSNQNILRLTSKVNGFETLGSVSAAVTVGVTEVLNAAIVETFESGTLVFKSDGLVDDFIIFDVTVGRPSGVLVNDASEDNDAFFEVNGVDQGYGPEEMGQFNDKLEINNALTKGIDDLPEQQVTTNPGEAGSDSFKGDADGTKDQTWTNPDADNDALYGAEAGHYEEGKLVTDHKDGTVFSADGDYFVDSRISVGDGSEVNDGGTAGESVTLNRISNFSTIQAGYVPFDNDDAAVSLISTGNSGADVVYNFQTAYDKIVIEGALAETTDSGEVDVVLGAATSQLKGLSFEIIHHEDNDIDANQVLIKVPGNVDLTQPFGFTNGWGSYGNKLFVFEDFGNEYIWSAYSPDDTGPLEFANWQDFVDALNTSPWTTSEGGKDVTTPALTGELVTQFNSNGFTPVEQGILITNPAGLSLSETSGPTKYMQATTVDKAYFDLDTDEFGLITSALNTGTDKDVTAADLTNVAKVTDLLNSLFDFNADGDDDQFNTSIFAVTAADDSSKTAIWAHQQSTADDSSVDSMELHLLGLVNTVDEEFGLHNLFIPNAPILS